jgi:hypothetical protein
VCETLGSSATLLATLGSVLGAVSWSGHVEAIPLSLLTLVLLGLTKNRKHCLLLMFSYYAGATWQIVPAASVFFGHHVQPVQVVVLWLAVGTTLAAPWALLWSPIAKIRLYGAPFAVVLLAFPPLGMIGCGSPLTASGVLFPGLAWLGLLLTLLICGLSASYPFWALVLTLLFALPANLIDHVPVPPPDWQVVSTHLGGVGLDTPDPLADFAAAQFLQETALSSRARVIVFPETVVSNWNEATEAFWGRTSRTLRRDGKTILVGANVSANNPRHYFNSIIIRGADAQADFRQRIPLPIAMWTPYNGEGVPLRLNGPATLIIEGHRAAVLICYEQLLIWPAVTSFAQHPTIVLGVANEYWAQTTTIPEIQRACLTSWSRLFHLPMLWAENT